MSSDSFPIDNVSSTVAALLGRPADAPSMVSFLQAVGAWPLPPLPPDEFHVFVERRSEGYSLTFEDAAVAKGSPELAPRTLVFTSAFFYSEGKDGYRQFDGAMPHGVTWGDTPGSLVAKLGAPKSSITSKKTGRLQSHKWEIDGGLFLSTVFKPDGALGHVYLGIR